MSRFEFIFVLDSIIAGLALAQLLSGLTRYRRSPSGGIDFAHLMFSLSIVLLLITVWWATFRWEEYEHWTYDEFVLLCGYFSLFYVIAVILYPTQSPDVPQFSEIRTRFYLVFIVYCVWEPVVMYVRDGTLAPWYYLPMMVHLVVLSGIGLVVRKVRFDQIFATWLFLVNFAWPFLARMAG